MLILPSATGPGMNERATLHDTVTPRLSQQLVACTNSHAITTDLTVHTHGEL